MSPYLECKFSCEACGVKNALVPVTVRRDESVTEWMDREVIPTVASAHRYLSPGCKATKLTQLMIPMSDLGVGFLPTGDENK